MAFVKLDCGILNSTIWFDRTAREIFITALLMAEPMELTESTPQMRVNSLDDTGWSVPPGWYGFVPAAGPGLIRRAGIDDMEAGMAALERLGSPEPESRSQEHGGRRLVRVNHGYIVLNFVRYRERDHTSAERSRRWRERTKATRRVVSESQRDEPESVSRERDTTQAEAEIRSRSSQKQIQPQTQPPDRAHARGEHAPCQPAPPPAAATAAGSPSDTGAEPEDPGRETVCPLDLPSRPGVVSMLRELAERLPAPLASLQHETAEYVTYWTIGGGAGDKRAGWPRRLRTHLVKRARENQLTAPGALEHGARMPPRARNRRDRDDDDDRSRLTPLSPEMAKVLGVTQ